MGNRAVIITRECDLAVYLHWNGGRDSVEAFLAYCRLRGFRPPEEDNYGWARLCQVLGNFFGKDGLSVGLYPVGSPADPIRLSPGDNGVYVIKDWQIVGRYDPPTEEQDGYDLKKMVRFIDSRQPEDQRLTSEELQAWEESLNVSGESPKADQ